MILEPKKIKSVTVSIVSPSICHDMMGPDALILASWMLSFFFFFFRLFFYLYFWRLITLQYCIGFAIHWHESATVYMCSPSWTPLPPLSPSHPSGSSQCTSPEHPVSCIEPGLVIHFTYDINPNECWVLSQLFHSPLSLSSRDSLVLLHFLP